MSNERLHPRDVITLEPHASALHAPSAWLVPAAIVCLIIGVVGFIAGVMIAPGRAWASFLANFMFWTGLAQAAVVVAAAFNVSYAWWGRAIQRMLVGLAAWLPFSIIAYLVLYFGRTHIFWWLHEAPGTPWLEPGWLGVRDVLILVGACILSGWWLYRALRPDMGELIDEGIAQRKGLAALLTRGWTDDEVEELRTLRSLKVLSPVIILYFVLGFSILAIDLEMSLTQDFRSTMFPVIYWIGSFYAAFAAGAVLTYLWRRCAHCGTINEIFSTQQTQDLGNMLWGSAIFWGYVSWSQYFVIWMGNLPSESNFIIQRWRVLPWGVLAYTALFCAFVAPFLLLFARGLKRNPKTLAGIATLSVIGILLQQFVHVMPVILDLGPSMFGLVEVAITVGFLGAVALPYLWLMRRVPLFPIEDPLFLRALETRGVEV